MKLQDIGPATGAVAGAIVGAFAAGPVSVALSSGTHGTGDVMGACIVGLMAIVIGGLIGGVAGYLVGYAMDGWKEKQ